MNWQELIYKLRLNHLYPSLEVKDEVIQELHVFCPAIQKMSRMKAVRDVIGDEKYDIDFLPNDEVIVITERK